MPVFLTSPWIPAEWVAAHGLEPRGIWGEPGFCRGALPLSAGVCAFAEACARFAGNCTHPPQICPSLPVRNERGESRREGLLIQNATSPRPSPPAALGGEGEKRLPSCRHHPDTTVPGAVTLEETSEKAAVVFATTCDQLRRGFDSVSRGAPAFLFNVPATWQTPAARQLFRGEIERLGRFLQELGGRTPSPEQLREAMRQQGEARARLQAARGERATDGVPLALVGGPLPAAQGRLLEIIEAAGGRVVLDATENGEPGRFPPLDPGPAGADPLEALVSGYLENLAGVFQRPNTPLYAWLRPRLIARQARGIVLWHFTGCDLWRAEAQSLRETFGLPVLLLEADEAQSGSPRDLGRLEAFVETLR
jgi:benzoyl-CoA reductase/2-hydroxyglutaryl-CoA dehydratase subunit BcrC/BadD/HgdB